MLRLAHNYYERSGYSALVAVGLALAGCAGPNSVARSAPTFPFESFENERSPELVRRLQNPPYIVKFKAGQVIPVDFTLDSQFLEAREEDFVIVAKRDFYLLFRADGPPLLSADGVEFEDRPRNYFRFGFRMKDREPTTIDFGLGVRPEKK
jgi:hypothetical protein